MGDTDDDYSDDEDYEDEDFGNESAQEDGDAEKHDMLEGGGNGNGSDHLSVEQGNDESQQPLDWDVNAFSSVLPPEGEIVSDDFDPNLTGLDTSATDTNNRDAPVLQSLDSSSGAQNKTPGASTSKPQGGARSSVDRSDSNDARGEDTVREKAWEASEKLVREAEKNVSLALELEKCNGELSEVRGEIEQFSRQLLQGINGGVADVDNYRHIPLGELLRLRLQEGDHAASPGLGVGGGTNIPGQSVSSRQKDDKAEAASIGGIQKLERELASEQQRNEALERKCTALHEKLALTSREVQEVGALKQKVTKLVERSRTERDLRARADKEVSVANEKVEVLSEHIEKLMVHLKHEAISKVRALNDLSRSNREVDLLQARSHTMAKRNARKDEAISDLKEGAKILEDQLKLMDEKYMELRLKLDWTRTQTQLAVKKKEEELQHLRSKFALLAELMPRGDKKGKLATPLLDEVDFGQMSKSKPNRFQTRGNNANDAVSSPTALSPKF